MKTRIALLTINTLILVYWVVTGVYRAMYAPTWECMLDGSAITLYVIMVTQNIISVVKAVKEKKTTGVNNNPPKDVVA